MDKGSHALEYILALLLKTCQTFVEGINIVWRDLRPSYVSFHNLDGRAQYAANQKRLYSIFFRIRALN